MKKLILKPPLESRLNRLEKKAVNLHFLGNDPNILANAPTVAVVGTRKPTPYGKQITEQLVSDLVRAGVVIVSGLAFGIDVIAHRAALEEDGVTISVLPSGLDSIYPATNQGVAKQILKKGSLISEYPSKHTPRKVEFLERNRIIAALSDIVVIPEAAERSGSLNTASHARSMGIPVCAFPGQVTGGMSRGTNQILKDGYANIITSANDVLKMLNIETSKKKNLKGNNKEETAILEAISSGAHDSAQLQHELKMDTVIFQNLITMLEIDGKIQQDETGSWHLS